jgi:hypothetical protein
MTLLLISIFLLSAGLCGMAYSAEKIRRENLNRYRRPRVRAERPIQFNYKKYSGRIIQ